MPTLFRLLLVIGVLVTLVWGTMLAMVTYLKPQTRTIEQNLALPNQKK